MPIGTPIKNMHVFLLHNGNIVNDKNVIGEICISGVGVAQGYLNTSEEIMNKFITNAVKQNLEYHTGDLGYFLDENLLMYLGRQDDEIKINGQKVH